MKDQIKKPWFMQEVKFLATEKRKSPMQKQNHHINHHDKYKKIRNRVQEEIQSII